jgi:hypothetical protein
LFLFKEDWGEGDYHDFCVSTFFGENVSFSHHSAGFKQKQQHSKEEKEPKRR